MNARLYDPKLGRMLSVDNYVSDAGSPLAYNRYSYANCNPVSYVDPDGNHPVLIAMAIGAAISAATYTAQAAFAPGGLSRNFNVGDFVGTTISGGALGGVTAGVGHIFGPTLVVGEKLTNGTVVTFGMSFTREAGRAAAHGLIGGGFSAAQGGDFVTGFVSGSLSAFAGHALAMKGVTLSKVGGAFFSMGVGAGTSYLQGGNPWIGAGAALMSYSLNQLLSEKVRFNERTMRWYGKTQSLGLGKLVSHYMTAEGDDFIMDGESFGKLIAELKANNAFEGRKYEAIPGVPWMRKMDVSTYGTSFANSCGSITLYELKGRFVGYSDLWNFESQQAGNRTNWAEFKTFVGAQMPGSPFMVYYGLTPIPQYIKTH